MGSGFVVPGVIKSKDITGSLLPNPSGIRPPSGLPHLLEKFAELGSLREAAAAAGLDEDQAWSRLVTANNLSEVPLLQARADHASATPVAARLLGRSESLAEAFQGVLDAPAGGTFRQFHLRRQVLVRLQARCSARNQFFCQVRLLFRERVNAVATLDLGGGDHIEAQITARSAETLGLASGSHCHALIDPAWVEVQSAAEAAGSARQNSLAGRVVRCREDPVDSEVTIALAGGRLLLASMTRAEMEEKTIRVGSAVWAVIQSSQIILAVAGQSPALGRS